MAAQACFDRAAGPMSLVGSAEWRRRESNSVYYRLRKHAANPSNAEINAAETENPASVDYGKSPAEVLKEHLRVRRLRLKSRWSRGLQIIECHGGRLSVISNPGRAATFQFTLPAISPGHPAQDRLPA